MLQDSYGRKIDYIRLSLTDRCQLRCQYCLPEAGAIWTAADQLLTVDEIKAMVQAFAKLGVRKVKLTGGEPLLYPNLSSLIPALKGIAGIEEVTLTTNGVKLATMITQLVAAGLDGINISLDTLDQARYISITGQNQLDSVLAGLRAALASPIKEVKINCVLTSKDEILAMASLAKESRAHVRFIELMPIGRGKTLTAISEAEVCQILSGHYGALKPFSEKLGNGPAHYVEIAGFKGKIGFISAISQHFCEACNRVRITADGSLKVCLCYEQEVNLKNAIQADNLEAQILEALKFKPKRHCYDQEIWGKTTRSMNQIGG